MVLRVDLKGSSHEVDREIGIQHGQALRRQIMDQVVFYGEMFKARCNLGWPQVLDISREFQSTFQRLAPDLLEEIEGIAQGVRSPEISVLDIIALNCRSEIALGRWTDGCTSLGWNIRSARSHKQFLAQNWDWKGRMKDNIALMSIEGHGKPKIFMVTEAGIVGKIGFNSRSVGVCLNAIRARPMLSSLLPVHVLLRLILESSSVSEAIKMMGDLGGCAGCAHMLVADPSCSKGVEMSPLGTEIIHEDEDGIVVHSNHFLLNRFVEEPEWLKDSPLRIKRMRKMCAEIIQESHASPNVSFDRLRKLFRDRENPPGSICRQFDPQDTASSESLFNIVMDLGEGTPTAEVVFAIGKENEGGAIHMPW